MYLSNRGYAIPKASLSPNEIQSIKKELTVKPYTYGPNTADASQYFIFQESINTLYVPKAYGLKRFGVSNLIRKNEDKIQDICSEIHFLGKLREEQEQPVNDILDACHDPCKRGGLLNIFCGGGKTTMALYTLTKLGKKCAIVVHKDFLLNQWKERIYEFLGDKVRVGLIKGKVIDIDDKDIVLISLQSLAMKEFDRGLFSTFGTIVFDEVHHTSAEVFNRALFKVSFLYTIGLTATITRKDGLSKVFIWHLGDVVYKSVQRSDMVQVEIIPYYNHDVRYCTEEYMYNNKPNYVKMVNNICFFDERNESIKNRVLALLELERDRKILVLSDRVKQLTDLKARFDLVNPDIAGVYRGGMGADALKQSEQKQVILATFAIASEGYDQKGLNTLVLASPKSDIVQSVGRILRDKEEDRIIIPLIIDFADDFGMFRSQGKKRCAYYKKCKYSVKVVSDD